MNDLMYAIKGANTEHALALLKSGAPHSDEMLCIAAAEGMVAVVKALLRRGAHVNVKDADGWTSLLHACRGDHAEIADILCMVGASVELAGPYGKTALNWAAGRGHKGTMLVLMDHGANINAEDDYGWTPLMLASLGGYLDAVKLLCLRGADVTVVKAGKTALTHAANEEVAAVIRAYGG